MHREYDDGASIAQTEFRAGIDDVIILPLVLIAVAVKYVFKTTLSLLIFILDYAFPILLQLVRFPLFTARIIGDGFTALLSGIVRCLPVSGSQRQEWRQAVRLQWAWLRQKMSYRAFEQTLHHAFEGGMAWVFRKCRTLTPGGALLVMAGAVLWLPISFGVATAMHAVLLAKAASLPAWMQLLHPIATIIAKSKLLVLPAYPAAWPQAKKHPIVQAIIRLYRYCTRHPFFHKIQYRYRQTEHAVIRAAHGLRDAAALAGLGSLRDGLESCCNRMAVRIGKAARAIMTRSLASLRRLPALGPIVQSYIVQYEAVEERDPENFSEKMTRFFQRWSIKFSPDYYEAGKLAELPSAAASRRMV